MLLKTPKSTALQIQILEPVAASTAAPTMPPKQAQIGTEIPNVKGAKKRPALQMKSGRLMQSCNSLNAWINAHITIRRSTKPCQSKRTILVEASYMKSRTQNADARAAVSE